MTVSSPDSGSTKFLQKVSNKKAGLAAVRQSCFLRRLDEGEMEAIKEPRNFFNKRRTEGGGEGGELGEAGVGRLSGRENLEFGLGHFRDLLLEGDRGLA